MICSFQSINSKIKCGCSSMVEFRPSKPAVRVRSPSPAPLKIKDYVVIIAKRIHLFPFRTQKLSSLALMVLGGQPPGRVRRSHVYGPLVKRSRHRPFTAVTGVRFPYGSPIYPGTIAQLGEHLTYKQGVTGSSPVSPTNMRPGSSVG